MRYSPHIIASPKSVEEVIMRVLIFSVGFCLAVLANPVYAICSDMKSGERETISGSVQVPPGFAKRGSDWVVTIRGIVGGEKHTSEFVISAPLKDILARCIVKGVHEFQAHVEFTCSKYGNPRVSGVVCG